MLSVHALDTSEVEDANLLPLAIETTREHGERAIQLLGIETPVHITIYTKSDWTIQETGETGYTPTADWIQVTLDLTGKKHVSQTVITERLPATIYHEMCHVKRWLTTGFGSTFREELISEGLSCVFEMESWKHDIKPLFLASAEEIEGFLQVVRTNKDRIENQYSYLDWFTRGDKDIPRWLGYKLGYFVVSEAKRYSPGITAPQMMELSADKIIEMSRVQL